MSLSLRCDDCGSETADFTLPQRFTNDAGETVISISIERGEKSLDFCRVCFTNLLVMMATIVKPEHVMIDWKDKREMIVTPEMKRKLDAAKII